MKCIALLVLSILAGGSVAFEQQCVSSQRVNPTLLCEQWVIGGSSVPILSIRNIDADPKPIAAQEFKGRIDHAVAIGKADYYKILAIGQGLVAVIENLWAHLQRSLKATPFGNISSGQINSDLGRMDDQLEEFMSLKPGNQEIDANLNEMPAEPTYHSISGNLTAADAFLNFARVKDDEIAQHTAFGASIGWHAWSATRRVLPLLQKQYRNEVLNNKVFPVYKNIVNNVYSSGVQSFVDEVNWSRLVVARHNINELWKAYIASLETGEQC